MTHRYVDGHVSQLLLNALKALLETLQKGVCGLEWVLQRVSGGQKNILAESCYELVFVRQKFVLE
jgi:hypothetical protein